MLLAVVDLIAFLCLAVQFVIAGYFLYLVYWSIELPPADPAAPALPDELPRVLVQIPVYNEPLVIDRVAGRLVVDQLKDLAMRAKCAVVLSTHDERIFDVASRRLHIEDGRCFDVPIHYH